MSRESTPSRRAVDATMGTMDDGWVAILTAVGWTVVLLMWEVLTAKVPNGLVVAGVLGAAIVAIVDHRPGWHALGLGVTFVCALMFYRDKMLAGGTVKGLGALGGILGLGAAPALVVVMLSAVALQRVRGKSLPSGLLYLGGIAATIGLRMAHIGWWA
jgi:Flp pilus assembly protein protease CpaA